MDNPETLQKVGEAILQEPIRFEIDVIPQNFIERKLQDWGIRPRTKVYSIRPIVLGNLIRISKIISKIDVSALKEGNLLEGNYKIMEKDGEGLARIVAIAISNTKAGPPERLVKFLLWNFTSAELAGIVLLVLRQMGLQNFMNTIISIRGLNVLDRKNGHEKQKEVSPMMQGS